jgi:3-hydroxybutyryl-CoA dehydrogenase
MAATIHRVFIVGAGLMGGGIAQVCAQSGFEVTITDVDAAIVEKTLKTIAWSVGKLVEKGSVKDSVEVVMGRIKTSHDYKPAGEADLVLEAVFESLDVKRDVFQKLDEVARPESVMASNTSAISISDLASFTKRPAKFVGIHFFSPVPMMPAAEVIRGHATSEETFAAGVMFVHQLGKEPILVQKDVPGFVINRINFRANLEAMRLVEEGVATVEDIDKGLRLASGRRMGIFETGDLVGLDITHGALMFIYETTKDPYWYPPAILRRKVRAGHLGRKTGKGWYEYQPDGTRKIAED